MERPELKRSFKISNRRIYHQNPYIRIVDYDTEADGRPGLYTVVERKDAAIIMLEHPEKGILLEKNYRFPIQDFSWELPMGGIEDHESPLSAAIRQPTDEIVA